MDTQKLLKNVLEKEEHHRQLIAYEIHDGISQYLSAAIMHLEAYKANPSDNPRNRSKHDSGLFDFYERLPGKLDISLLVFAPQLWMNSGLLMLSRC